MGGWIAALDMGGTFVKGCVFDREIAPVTDFVSSPVNSQGGREEILDTVGDLLGRLCGGREISAVSISTPGPFDYRRGEAKMTAKYGGIYAVPLRPALRSRSVPRCAVAPDCAKIFPWNFFRTPMLFCWANISAARAAGMKPWRRSPWARAAAIR